MKLEYQEDINEIKRKELFLDCPPSHYSSKNYDAFRFVFEKLEKDTSFKPVYHINPKRFLNTSALTKCKSISLSLYDSEKNAKNKFSELFEQIGDRIFTTIGSHLAFAELKEEDGICDTPNKDGHISHFFIENFDYQNNFKIISTLLK